MRKIVAIIHKSHLPKLPTTINTIKWRSLSQSLLSQLLLLHSHLLLLEWDRQLNPLLLSPLQMEEETTRRPVLTWTLRRCLICKSLFIRCMISTFHRRMCLCSKVHRSRCLNELHLGHQHLHKKVQLVHKSSSSEFISPPIFHLLQTFNMIGSTQQITRKVLMKLLRRWREARRSKLNIKLMYHGFISSLSSFLFVEVEKDVIPVPWACEAS